MKISLISPAAQIASPAVRMISAYLKKHGYKTQLIFLPDPDPFCDRHSYSGKHEYIENKYSDDVMEEVVSLCRDSDLIGISLMTDLFSNAVQITNRLKSRLNTPVIWGGIHPIIKPDESLTYADIVCIGDGEEAMLELAAKMDSGSDYSTIAGLWCKVNGITTKNQLRPLTKNLDTYPIPDYSMEDHHILFDRHIIPLTHKHLEIYFRNSVNLYLHINKAGYLTMTSRGCPHSCAYCFNSVMKNLYKEQAYLRWRSIEHVICELSWVKERMPYIDFVLLLDDLFFARPLEDIERFSREYKNKIGLPFMCATSPLTVTEEKMASLVDAGLIYVEMGIQSASKKIQNLYGRNSMSNERIMQAATIINKFKDRVVPIYDFIMDSPYETVKDQRESLKYVSMLPKPFRLSVFSLVFYPGTKIYAMAKEDGFIEDEKKQVYEKHVFAREPNYLNLLMVIAKGGKFPSMLLRLFLIPPFVDILTSKPIRPLVRWFYIFLKTIHGKYLAPKNRWAIGD